MEFEKEALPSYHDVQSQQWRRRRSLRRSRGFRYVALACLGFIVYAQWRQLSPAKTRIHSTTSLSLDRLEDDLAVCSKLRSKPQDPVGFGRERNGRYVDGHKPTLIRNATVWTGEPKAGTSAEAARAGEGYSWIKADVYLEYGLIKHVGKDLDPNSFAAETIIWDAKGRQLTSGIIDMHSHAGVDSLPELRGNADYNEMSSDVTPYVRSIDGINPLDHQIQVIKSGGVTTSLILPGSSNNIAGEAFPIKHAVGKADGRNETSIADLLADPDRTWRYMKMACGENAKRTYGKPGERGPTSRLGESWEYRHAFETAAKLIREQDDWCNQADAIGVQNMATYLPQELQWESLTAVLRGQVHVNTHCYTIPDLEAFIDHTNEFKFPIRAFHHAHQTFLVPEVLKRAWGDSPPASALFADNMWYKAESYIGSEFAGKVLWENGLTPIYVSDNPVINAQHVVFEAAKAFGYGLPYHAALASVTTAPAERLGLDQRIGKIKPGFDADVVVWDSDPLSVGATPVQVWIDGTAQFDDPIELVKPLTESTSAAGNGVADQGERVPVPIADVVFTGVTDSFLFDDTYSVGDKSNIAVAVTDGRISCFGSCIDEIKAAAQNGVQIVPLTKGHITKSFIAFGSLIGLNAIDAETSTDNGASTENFSRGSDGLRLDTKKLHYAHKYGVTRAISAPKYTGAGTHFGTSVGFRTNAVHTLEDGAIFADDVAVHYTLDNAAKSSSGSVSAALGALRQKLLDAVGASNITDTYSEKAFLKKVVDGKLPLSLTVHSADGIAGALKLKSLIEETNDSEITLVIIGGAESHLLADELAAANVGVVLSPLLSYRNNWDQRRALTGAPLTNGTAIDRLLDAGVVAAIGLEEDWLVRDLGLLAGIAYKNGGGRLSQKDALDLVGSNIYKILGLKSPDSLEDFVVFEGNPLEVGARVKAVASGYGPITLFQ